MADKKARCTSWQDKWIDEIDGNGDKIGTWCEAANSGYVFCRFCKKEVSICQGGLTRIKGHAETQKHKTNAASLRNTKRLTVSATPRISGQTKEDKKTDAEIRLAVFAAEHDLPFLIFDTLSKTLIEIFSDSQIAQQMKIKRQKANYVITFGLATYFKKVLSADLQSKVFSLMIDEGSIGDRKWLAAMVRHVSSSGKVMSDFLFIRSVSKADAETLKDVILSELAELKIPFKNCLSIMCDSANVMRGSSGGVITLLQKNHPGVMDIGGCILHHVHNATASALTSFGDDEIEDVLDDVFNYLRFAKSATAFAEAQEVLDLEPLRYKRHVKTRWLQIFDVIERHILLHPVLLNFFNDLSTAEKAREKVRRILSKLNSPDFLVYLHFLQYALKPFKRFELFFQCSDPVIHKLYDNMNALVSGILRCFVRPEHIEEFENLSGTFPKDKQLRDQDMLIGEGTRLALRNDYITAVQRATFFSRARSFFNALITQIVHYLPLKVRVLRTVRFLDPDQKDNVPEKDIVYLSKKLNLDGDVDELKLEWRCFCCKDFKLDSNGNIEQFWIDRAHDEEGGERRFPQLSKLAQHALCLPHGNADTERLMSALNRILRRDRNRITDPTLNGLLQVKTYLSVRNISAHSLEINSEIREAVHQANANYCSQMQKLAHRESLEREREERKVEEAVRRAYEINERKRVEKQKGEKRKLAMEYLEHAKNLMLEIGETISEEPDQADAPKAKKKKLHQ